MQVPPVSTDVLVDRLISALGAQHALIDPDLCAPYEIDPTRRWEGRARIVVRPATTEEVVAVLRICNEERAPVVPQGGNTGLVGGGIPRDGEVVLSLRRLDDLSEVDEGRADILAGAGATLEHVQNRAREAGLDFPVDLTARGSATVGGMAATNAGGAMAFRYGTMGRQIAGIEAVTANGSVIDRLGGLTKDNAGYQLPGLIIGSEGTLAVITSLRLRVIQGRRRRATALCGLPTASEAFRLSTTLQRHAPTVEAIDFFDATSMSLACAHRGLPQPLRIAHPLNAIVECAADDEPVDELAAALERFSADLDATIADDTSGRLRLWEYRETLNEAVSARGVPHKIDVGVPVDAVGVFTERVRTLLTDLVPGAEIYLWGHLGDGNVHVNVLGAEVDDERIEEAVLRAAVALGGTISSEHGIGRAKCKWLPLMRSAADISAMEAIKNALDPHRLLSPGRVLLGPASRA